MSLSERSKQNIGVVDAYLRLFSGLSLLALGAGRKLGRTGSFLAVILGASKVAEGITRYCPVYDLFELTSVGGSLSRAGRKDTAGRVGGAQERAAKSQEAARDLGPGGPSPEPPPQPGREPVGSGRARELEESRQLGETSQLGERAPASRTFPMDDEPDPAPARRPGAKVWGQKRPAERERARRDVPGEP